ncbi:hypothetical protein PILCRDRAFT_415253 [Piloderma croceum F 1598]|uniref:MYND-type domain-containing protein n=1 Tax=Piloderma croceum (strain F 1598) TaxID=765440 RepID=A0A0C3G004_PILCF|nr:hypothetical protein PILCRDRAFT_415253 [Piloderma croceum F 1598]
MLMLRAHDLAITAEKSFRFVHAALPPTQYSSAHCNQCNQLANPHVVVWCCGIAKYCSKPCQYNHWVQGHFARCHRDGRTTPPTCRQCRRELLSTTTPDHRTCLGCLDTFYCSEGCQLTDWRQTHHRNCANRPAPNGHTISKCRECSKVLPSDRPPKTCRKCIEHQVPGGQRGEYCSHSCHENHRQIHKALVHLEPGAPARR